MRNVPSHSGAEAYWHKWRLEFVPMGTRRPLAALAAEKGLGLRLDSPDGEKAAAEAARSGDVPPMSRQYEMVRLGEFQ